MRSFHFQALLILLLVPVAFAGYKMYRGSRTEKPSAVPDQKGSAEGKEAPLASPGPEEAGASESPSSAPEGVQVKVEVYIPPLDLPIGSAFREVLACLDALEKEFPQTLQVKRFAIDDPATQKAMDQAKISMPGTILVNGRDVHTLREGNQEREVVLRLGKFATLQFTPNDLEAVIRQALHAKGPAADSPAN